MSEKIWSFGWMSCSLWIDTIGCFFIFFKLRMNSTENSELLQQKQNTEARDKV